MPSRDTAYAPAVKPYTSDIDHLTIGHRLMAAKQPELALSSFKRAAARDGLTAEILTALGSANLALGRLNQSERMLRQATKAEGSWPETWNNLGVVLMERGKTEEASQVFRKAYALDNGESDAIRDNLRLALAKIENPGYDAGEEEDYKLVRRGSADYQIQQTP